MSKTSANIAKPLGAAQLAARLTGLGNRRKMDHENLDMKMRQFMLSLLVMADIAALPSWQRRNHWPIRETTPALLQAFAQHNWT